MAIDALVILGPTAVGKTDVGVILAKLLNGEIISCDSMQVYVGMDIGTAKPTLEEQKQTRYHLIDIVKPCEYYSAASYQIDAKKAIDDIRNRAKLPIIVGGTGLYLRALLDGYGIPPGLRNDELRLKLRVEAEQYGSIKLYERLSEIDPITATRLSPNDLVRIIRALEVYHETGKTISAQQTRDPLPLNVLKFGMMMERQELCERINQRVDKMLEAGWLAEVEGLLKAGYSSDFTPMRSLGYRHLLDYLTGQRVDFAEINEAIKGDTRRFAKRQMTWFRRENNVHWINAQIGAEKIAAQIFGEVYEGGVP